MEDSIDVYNLQTIEELTLLDIDISIILTLIEKIKRALTIIGISHDALGICYKRFSNKNSILGIKVMNGEDSDISNYMFIGCTPDNNNNCNIYLHSEAKSSKRTISVINLLTQDLIQFFNQLEKDLQRKGLDISEFSFKVGFDEGISKRKKDSPISKLFKRFINK